MAGKYGLLCSAGTTCLTSSGLRVRQEHCPSDKAYVGGAMGTDSQLYKQIKGLAFDRKRRR